MRIEFKQSLASLLLAGLMSGCGGGAASAPQSASASATPVSNAAQNVYFSGFIDQTIAAVVMPDGRFYVPLRSGVAVGQGSVSASAFTGSYSDFSGSSPQSGTLNATFIAGSSFNGTLSESGSATPLQGFVLPSSDFSFITPASLANSAYHYRASIAGNACGFDVTVSLSQRSINAQPLSGYPSSCSFSGTLTPDANYNFYNVAVTCPASGCPFPAQNLSGIVVFYDLLYADGVKWPEFMMVLSSSSQTFLLTGAQNPNNLEPVP